MKKKRIIIIVIILLALTASFLLGRMTEQSRHKFPITETSSPERTQLEVSIDNTIQVLASSDPIIRVGESIISPSEDRPEQSDPDQPELNQAVSDQKIFSFERPTAFSIFTDLFEINLNLAPLPEPQACPETNQSDGTGKTQASSQTTGRYVASKNGTKFHDPDCRWALKIKDENKVWFQTAEEAIAAGYEPSSCATLD